MEYHKTKDILHVMQLLGHKNIKNTLIYTRLIQTKDDDFICKTAKTVDQAKNLLIILCQFCYKFSYVSLK